MTKRQMDPKVREFLEGLKELMERTGVEPGFNVDDVEFYVAPDFRVAWKCKPEELEDSEAIRRILEGQV